MPKPIIHIVDNDEESGDWVSVFIDGKKVVSGHRIYQHDVKAICEALGAEVHEHTTDDDGINAWEPPK